MAQYRIGDDRMPRDAKPKKPPAEQQRPQDVAGQEADAGHHGCEVDYGPEGRDGGGRYGGLSHCRGLGQRAAGEEEG